MIYLLLAVSVMLIIVLNLWHFRLGHYRNVSDKYKSDCG
jgi:hypothetical protein